ncbi:MAG: hypothetical protein H7099_20930 [Gemmatimonadaceae bacterium]|nr:hypothetical protein [Gemmatimonadaceae bacterium]
MTHSPTRVLIAAVLLAVAVPVVAQQTYARAEPAPASGRTGVVSQAKKDSLARKEQLSYRREIFSYASGGRRDPFVSLATTGVLRPTIADLSLVGIAYATQNNAAGSQSIAIFRDKTTKEQYRVRVGQPLGRMRVASIEPRRVVFSIDEFGISRQESIAMGDSTRTITPTRAP